MDLTRYASIATNTRVARSSHRSISKLKTYLPGLANRDIQLLYQREAPTGDLCRRFNHVDRQLRSFLGNRRRPMGCSGSNDGQIRNIRCGYCCADCRQCRCGVESTLQGICIALAWYGDDVHWYCIHRQQTRFFVKNLRDCPLY